MFEVIIAVSILIWLFFKWWNINNSYWKDRGFPFIETKFPYGSNKDLIKMDRFFGYIYNDIYAEIGDKPYAGVTLLRRPHLIVKDPEIIKLIMLKDFNHFTDRTNVDNIKEPLSEHLFNLGGDKWKALRVKMTPTFTSGKLKLMFPLFQKCSDNLLEILEKMTSTNREIDVKDIMGRYTTKIVGTCAYGIDIDSLGDSNNHFVKIAQNIFSTNIPWKRYATMLTQMIFPGSEKLIRPRFAPVSVEQFLTSVVLDSFEYRQKTGLKRNDFIDQMMEIRNQGGIQIDSLTKQGKVTINVTDVDLVAQVFVFLGAGFETSSSVTTYCLYELAQNPDIQEKLRKEILANEPLTYQALHEMTYLDMVIHETMRKYPTLPVLSRKCTKTYRMPDGTVLENGIRVIIPVHALHHDPQYFPDPDKFDPERFTPENKALRPQFSYLPFGEGPRLCIGMRFGLMQTKMGIVTLLSKYRIDKTENTISPMEFVATPLISTIWHSVKLAFKPL